MFKKFITAAVATAVIATAAISAPTQAEAHNGIGLGIGLGILTGAVVGAAIANSNDHYYDHRYNGYPVVYENDDQCDAIIVYYDHWGHKHFRHACN